jgi:hypothetical protein
MTAWEGADDPRQLRQGQHASAMREEYGGALASAGSTGTWRPMHLVARVRSDACGQWRHTQGAGSSCNCGAVLPEPPALW